MQPLRRLKAPFTYTSNATTRAGLIELYSLNKQLDGATYLYHRSFYAGQPDAILLFIAAFTPT
jgi:hypothetical protein